MKREKMTQEQKQAQNKYNAPYVAKYNAANYDKLTIRIRKDGAQGLTIDGIKAAAEVTGRTVNEWVLDAIREKLSKGGI